MAWQFLWRFFFCPTRSNFSFLDSLMKTMSLSCRQQGETALILLRQSMNSTCVTFVAHESDGTEYLYWYKERGLPKFYFTFEIWLVIMQPISIYASYISASVMRTNVFFWSY